MKPTENAEKAAREAGIEFENREGFGSQKDHGLRHYEEVSNALSREISPLARQIFFQASGRVRDFGSLQKFHRGAFEN